MKIAPVMRDLASGMLSVYFFGESLCESISVPRVAQIRLTSLASPREGLFNCLITLSPGRDSVHGGASSRTKMHGTVRYTTQKYCLLYANSGSAIYSLITNRGKALQVTFRRLNKAMDFKQTGWHEREDLKSVSQRLRRVAPRDSSFDPVTDDAPPQLG